MPVPNKLSEDGGLRPMPDVDRMVGQGGLGQKRTHVRNVDKTPDG